MRFKLELAVVTAAALLAASALVHAQSYKRCVKRGVKR